MKTAKVLIVDDSMLFREILTQELERDVGIKVVAKASNVFEAGRSISKFRPDIVIIDVYMERMDGIEFIKQLLPQYYLPVIVISSDSSKRIVAEVNGAAAFFEKPESFNSQAGAMFTYNILMKIKSLMYGGDHKFTATEINNLTSKVIAVGASTGGANAIELLLKDLPPIMPPILISQHMPEGFTKLFADRINAICNLSVKEASYGDLLLPGQVYVAPGGYHMSVRRYDTRFMIYCEKNTAGNPICPSVDVLFNSVAEIVGADGIGVILTGMGKDGMCGLKKMREAGCFTVGQDEATSVIYGMPKAAYEAGAVAVQLPLSMIPYKLIDFTCVK